MEDEKRRTLIQYLLEEMEMVRQRPDMYVLDGRFLVFTEALRSYDRGFCNALGIEPEFRGFWRYLRDKYDVSSNTDWPSHIEEIAGTRSDAACFDKLPQLFREYLSAAGHALISDGLPADS